MSFPMIRLRRFRKTPHLRELVAETRLTTQDLVYPMFVTDRSGNRQEVSSMPGIYQQSIEDVLREINQGLIVGLRHYLLFGISDEKDPEGSHAWNEAGVVQEALRRIKGEFGDEVTVTADTCLCEYTTHGHCGIVMESQILNDPTLELLGRIAVSQAEAGADIIAPSDMMDGRVIWIRQALDEAGYTDIPIMAYSAKFASAFYSPFRDAAESSPQFGDRRTYQMDPRNQREALQEILLDLEEGADMVMVKPAMAYQDIIYQARQLTHTPIAAYSVSGEYSMIKAAAAQGWLDEQAAATELLTGIKRAGADVIITYHALAMATWLRKA